MRLDRFITLTLVAPFRRASSSLSATGRGPGRGVRFESVHRPLTSVFRLPILMYHSISDEPEPGRSDYYKTSTSPATFRQQMQFLADDGYRTFTLSQAVGLLDPLSASGGEAPHSPQNDSPFAIPHSPQNDSPFTTRHSLSRCVVLTFDDGFLDFHTEAFPVLKKHGFTATMFLPTGFISSSSLPSLTSVNRPSLNHNHTLNPNPISAVRPQSSALRPPSSGCHSPFATRHSRSDSSANFLSWDQVRELHRAGIEFGSHTVNHPKLVELGWDQIEIELRQSKLELEQQLGAPANAFCYPYAFPQTDTSFVTKFKRVLKQSGYDCCATTEIGRITSDSDPFQLKRLPINDCDDLALFQAKVEGHYDWLSWPQACVKRVKRIVHRRRSPASDLRPVTSQI
jgi:peptidoglycan/xylan/chitin deacetylase (PgdA/CDA1 family)